MDLNRVHQNVRKVGQSGSSSALSCSDWQSAKILELSRSGHFANRRVSSNVIFFQSIVCCCFGMQPSWRISMEETEHCNKNLDCPMRSPKTVSPSTSDKTDKTSDKIDLRTKQRLKVKESVNCTKQNGWCCQTWQKEQTWKLPFLQGWLEQNGRWKPANENCALWRKLDHHKTRVRCHKTNWLSPNRTPRIKGNNLEQNTRKGGGNYLEQNWQDSNCYRRVGALSTMVETGRRVLPFLSRVWLPLEWFPQQWQAWENRQDRLSLLFRFWSSQDGFK